MEGDDVCAIIDNPPDIVEAAKQATLNLLPEKSRVQYEGVHNEFKKWCVLKKATKINEDVLLAYFSQLSKTYKPSTLWSKYSMIKAVLIVKENINIKNFSKLIAFLKRCSDGFKSKKSKIFTKEQINKFMLEAPDMDFLMIKVVAIMGVSGACRRQELSSMTIDNIEDLGSAIIVKVPDTKTKVDRVFTITTQQTALYNNIDIFRKYVALRPPHVQHRRFFIFYKAAKCSTQPVGVHTMGKLPTKIAEYLKLEDCSSYTGHCFRRSSASFLADSGADLATIKRHGGWRSSTVAESYVENSLENKKKISNQIFSGGNIEKSINIAGTSGTSSTTGAILPEIISLNNTSNCTINVNVVINH